MDTTLARQRLHRAAPRLRRLVLQPVEGTRRLRLQVCRTMQSAHAWRTERMVERHVARIEAARRAVAAAGPVSPAAAQLVPIPVEDGPGVLNARHVVPAPAAPFDRQRGRGWIV